jgi:hypothetical protein
LWAAGGAAHSTASCARLRPCPRRCQEQDHCGRVEQQRNHENEPPQDHLVGLAEQDGKISDRLEIGVDDGAFTLDDGLLDLQVGEGLRLNHELVGKAA